MATPLSNKLEWALANPIWASALNPVIANPVNYSRIISGVQLAIGENVINHQLGRQMLGWFLTDIQGIANIFRSQPMNNLTLTLTSDAVVSVNLGVF